MRFDLFHPADQLVMIMERIYGYGMTTTSGGNLSIIDENGDIWITPGGVDKGTLSRRDIVQVKPDGKVIGNHKPSIELPFHALIYQKRPDIKAILHAHPPSLIAFSVVRKTPNTSLIPNAHIICGKVGMAEYDLPGSSRLGEKIASVFETGVNTVMLENHGVVVGGENLFKAFMSFETLDFCARLEITANRIGKPIELTQKYLMISKSKQHVEMNEFIPQNYSSKERNSRREMCELIHRAYEQGLFTSTQGTFSQRLDEKSFIITPYDVDRKYIKSEDIVRIDSGWKEIGKTPSRSVIMHKSIYDRHPFINSVIIAHPHHIMAYAITKEHFDSRVIPESYVMLKKIKKLPFGSNFMQPVMVADAFTDENPIIMIENDCIIVTGSSLLNAYDRLEVAEFTAKALISSKSIGSIVPIEEKQLIELEEVFKLK